MKQHAIPQNILDIEFKLFTKFTVREFIYIAVGVGFGGIFLFFFSKSQLPAIIAIPVFLVSSGTGLFLGIVPINDQNADVFLRNYIGAIRKPTQRVWKSEQFDEKVAVIAQSKGISLTTTTGSMDRQMSIDEKNTSRVVGGTSKNTPVTQFIEQETLNAIDEEEALRLEKIDQIAREALSEYDNKNVNTVVAALPSAQLEPVGSQQIEIPLRQEEPVQIPVETPVQNDAINSELVKPDNGRTDITEAQGLPQQPTEQPNTPTQQLSQTTGQSSPPSTQSAQNIVITHENANAYKTEVEGLELPLNSINLYLTDASGNPALGSMILIKDANGAIIRAHQTDPQGLVLTDKSLNDGEYIVDIKNDNYNFPTVNFILDGSKIPVINIKSI